MHSGSLWKSIPCPKMLGWSVEGQGSLAFCPGSTSACSWSGRVFQLSGGHKTIVYGYFESMRWDYWWENSREFAPSQTAI